MNLFYDTEIYSIPLSSSHQTDVAPIWSGKATNQYQNWVSLGYRQNMNSENLSSTIFIGLDILWTKTTLFKIQIVVSHSFSINTWRVTGSGCIYCMICWYFNLLILIIQQWQCFVLNHFAVPSLHVGHTGNLWPVPLNPELWCPQKMTYKS